jgi:hypothetical protein
MKTSLICLAIVLVFRLAFAEVELFNVEVFNDYGKMDDHDWGNKAVRVYISDGGGFGRWLTIVRPHGTTGFNPNFTHVVTKAKPTIEKLPNGLWQISFSSEP